MKAIFLILIGLVLLSSCKTRSTPEEVLTEFLIALGRADCERAIELFTGEYNRQFKEL